MKRSEVKEKHEESVLEAFKRLCASNGNFVEILSKPEPPDAIISINGDKTWVEITDAFINSDHARDITSKISDDKEWIQPKPQLIIVDNFNEIFKSVIKEKYGKNTIKEIYKKYGSGILIIGCFSPFHYPIQDNHEELVEFIKEIYSSNEKVFSEIYLYDYDYKLVRVM